MKRTIRATTVAGLALILAACTSAPGVASSAPATHTPAGPTTPASPTVVPTGGPPLGAFSGTFSSTGSMPTPRSGNTATLLDDGRVLVAGGTSADTSVASAAIYDPKTGTFSSTGWMATPRTEDTATLLADGRVLFAGGATQLPIANTTTASAELYDPTTGKFRQTGSTAAAHDGGTATLLADGRVLVVGGYRLASAELFRP